MTEPFEARVSIAKSALLVVGALVMAAAGGWLVYAVHAGVDLHRDPGLMTLLGWAGIVFFGLCAVVAARQLFHRGPVLRIGPEGLWWRRWSDETIPWSAFAGAAAAQIRRQRMITLWLRDPEAHRATGLLGRLAGANKALGFGDISLTAQGLDCRFEDIAEAVAAQAPSLFEH